MASKEIAPHLNHVNAILVTAAGRGNTRVLEFMLDLGADVNSKSEGKTALMLAAENGCDEVVRLLIKAGAHVSIKSGADVNKESDGKTALMLASENGRDEAVRLLTEASNSLTFAARSGDVESIGHLIKGGADVNKTDKSDHGTPLTVASFTGNHQCVDLLIQAGADVNLMGGIAKSPDYHNAELIALLFESGIKTIDTQENIGGLTPLSAASVKGHGECVKHLIKAGADVNKMDKWDLTPVIAASRGGHTQCAEALIQAGADVNIPSEVFRESALRMALAGGHHECALILMEAKADVNHKDVRHKTPLFYAYSSIKSSPFGFKCLRLLLRCGAEINRCKGMSLGTQAKVQAPELLLFAAGETKLIENLTFLVPKTKNLMEHCRGAIRKHLLKLDPHTHLFYRVPRLGLPAALQKFLLFDQTIDIAENEENN